MKRIVLVLMLVLCIIVPCIAEDVNIEDTVWKYYNPLFDFDTYYAFKGGCVYLLWEGGEYEFPNTKDQWALYGDDWAVMYQYESPLMWGLIISNFRTKKAVELFPLPPVLHFELEQMQ